MYALPQAFPFHLRAGATVCCGCSLLYGENNIDDEKPPFPDIIILILSE